MSVVTVKPSVRFSAVLALAKTAKNTVGFLPDSAYADRARQGTLLAKLDGDDVVGYVIYDLPRDDIKLIQLVVASNHRARGHARLSALSRRTASRRTTWRPTSLSERLSRSSVVAKARVFAGGRTRWQQFRRRHPDPLVEGLRASRSPFSARRGRCAPKRRARFVHFFRSDRRGTRGGGRTASIRLARRLRPIDGDRRSTRRDLSRQRSNRTGSSERYRDAVCTANSARGRLGPDTRSDSCRTRQRSRQRRERSQANRSRTGSAGIVACHDRWSG